MAKRIKNKTFEGLSDDRQPWERQKGETAKAHAAFAVYRDMGAITRSVLGACRSVDGNARSWHGWHKVMKWQDRAAAWDKYLDKKSLNAQISDVVKARKRFEGLGRALQAIGGHEMDVLLKKIKVQNEGDKKSIGLSKNEAMKFLREGIRLELIGLGEPVEPQSEGVEGASSYSDLARMAAEFEKKNRIAEIAEKERAAKRKTKKEGKKDDDKN